MADDIIRNVSFRRLRAVLALHETTLAVVAKKNGCTPSHLRFVMLGQRASSAALRAKLQRELSDHEWQFVRCEVDVLRDQPLNITEVAQDANTDLVSLANNGLSITTRGWNGRPFPQKAERLVLPDGRVLDDAIIWPAFCQHELGLNPDTLWQELLAFPIWPSAKPIPFRDCGDEPHWIRGTHSALRMRGHALKRGKIWCQSDYAGGLRKYGYTGWQHQISFATHAVEYVPPVRQFAERLNAGLVRSGHAPHNHWIVTRYEDENDKIGPHSDKEADFSENSFFIVIKLGEARPFAFHRPGEKKPFLTRTLSAGTAVFVRCKGVDAANHLIQHAVPPMRTPVGLSGSIVSRCIETIIPWKRVQVHVAKTQPKPLAIVR
jgi:hypothetical protein